MNEKEVIKQLLQLLKQATLTVQGEALQKLNAFLAYAEALATTQSESAEEQTSERPDASPDAKDAGVPKGSGDPD